MDSTDEAELQRTEDELTTLKEIVQEALENQGVLGISELNFERRCFQQLKTKKANQNVFQPKYHEICKIRQVEAIGCPFPRFS